MVTGDRINFHNSPDRPIHIRGSDEFIVDAPIQIKQVGVERYVEFGRNAQEKEDIKPSNFHLVIFNLKSANLHTLVRSVHSRKILVYQT